MREESLLKLTEKLANAHAETRVDALKHIKMQSKDELIYHEAFNGYAVGFEDGVKASTEYDIIKEQVLKDIRKRMESAE
jgi:hypothetical protein